MNTIRINYQNGVSETLDTKPGNIHFLILELISFLTFSPSPTIPNYETEEIIKTLKTFLDKEGKKLKDGIVKYEYFFDNFSIKLK